MSTVTQTPSVDSPSKVQPLPTRGRVGVGGPGSSPIPFLPLDKTEKGKDDGELFLVIRLVQLYSVIKLVQLYSVIKLV